MLTLSRIDHGTNRHGRKRRHESKKDFRKRKYDI